MMTLIDWLVLGNPPEQFPWSLAIATPMEYNSDNTARESGAKVGGKDFRKNLKTRRVEKIPGCSATKYQFKTCPLNTSSIEKATRSLLFYLKDAAQEEQVVTVASTMHEDFHPEHQYNYSSINAANLAKENHDPIFVEFKNGSGIYYFDTDSIPRPADEDLEKPYTKSLLKKHANLVLDRLEEETGCQVGQAVVHASSSAGFSSQIKLHVFWVSEALSARAELHERAQQLKKTDTILDCSVYSRGRKIYVRNPSFTNMSDPVEQRFLIIERENKRNDPLFLQPTDPARVLSCVTQKKRNTRKVQKIVKNIAEKLPLPEQSPITTNRIDFATSLLRDESFVDHLVSLRILRSLVVRHGFTATDLNDDDFRSHWYDTYYQKHHRRDAASNAISVSHAKSDQSAAIDTTLNKILSGHYVPYEKVPNELFKIWLKTLTRKQKPPKINPSILQGIEELTVEELPKKKFIADVFTPKDHQIIIAGTGTGKTYSAINAVIDDIKAFKNTSYRVVFAVASVALAKNVTETLNQALKDNGLNQTFQCYLDNDDLVLDDMQIDMSPFLVISIQSLWRLLLPTIYNTKRLFFIVEELNHSLGAMIGATVGKNFSKVRRVFKALCANATRFLGLDATMKSTQFLELKRLLPDESNLAVNAFRQNTDTRKASNKGYEIYLHKDAMLKRLYAKIQNNIIDGKLTKKIAVPTTSKSLGDAITKHLVTNSILSAEDIYLITSETKGDKREQFAHNNKPGLFIYSPTLSVGFDAKGVFDYVFAFMKRHYDEISIDEIEQQIGRIRHCRSVRYITMEEGSKRIDHPSYVIASVMKRIELLNLDKYKALDRKVQWRITDQKLVCVNKDDIIFAANERYTYQIANQNILLSFIAKMQFAGTPVWINPAAKNDRDLKSELYHANKEAKIERDMLVLNAPVAERNSFMENQNALNTITTQNSVIEKTRLMDQFGSLHADKFIGPDRNQKITQAIERATFLGLYLADYGIRLDIIERQTLQATGRKPSSGTKIRERITGLKTLYELAGFNLNVLKDAALHALRGEDFSATNKIFFHRVVASKPEKGQSPQSVVSQQSKDVFAFLEKNPKLWRLFHREVRNGPIVTVESYLQRKANGKKRARFSDWLLKIQKQLAKYLTGFGLKRKQNRNRNHEYYFAQMFFFESLKRTTRRAVELQILKL